MLILNNFFYGLILGLCPYVIHRAFEWADKSRGYDALGGEMIIYLLPIAILIWRFYTKGVYKNENGKN